jgi:hypothetical protein
MVLTINTDCFLESVKCLASVMVFLCGT